MISDFLIFCSVLYTLINAFVYIEKNINTILQFPYYKESYVLINVIALVCYNLDICIYYAYIVLENIIQTMNEIQAMAAIFVKEASLNAMTHLIYNAYCFITWILASSEKIANNNHFSALSLQMQLVYFNTSNQMSTFARKFLSQTLTIFEQSIYKLSIVAVNLLLNAVDVLAKLHTNRHFLHSMSLYMALASFMLVLYIGWTMLWRLYLHKVNFLRELMGLKKIEKKPLPRKHRK